ncbi:MAG TPA: RES family NAD+ phosphorylase [Solirubrobacteraceae bacterium]|nr:RES family NAD+ phosphorylase [Solirubrobacteraceae bacterium]
MTSYDVPLWVNPNRRSGRWNIARSEPTQYMTLDSEAPFAEMLRHENLRTEEAASHFRSTLWQLQVESELIVDYRSFELAEAAGFDPEALVADDHERCQAEAEWLRGHGARGLVSPSAALPGSVNLTLFGPRVCVPWGATPELASSIPAQRLTTGNPPAGLTARVHYYGESEPLLEEYLARVRRDG